MTIFVKKLNNPGLGGLSVHRLWTCAAEKGPIFVCLVYDEWVPVLEFIFLFLVCRYSVQGRDFAKQMKLRLTKHDSKLRPCIVQEYSP